MIPWQEQAATELSRIAGRNAYKKRETILAIVDARISGRSEESVWSLGETCSRKTYHEKWKKDALFADVLQTVSDLARGAREGIALESLADAAFDLALTAPAAVRAAKAMLDSEDEAIILRAAFGILDRAGMETATKQASEVSGNMSLSVEEWREQAETSRAQAAAALEDFEDD